MASVGIPVLENKYPVTMDMWPIEDGQFNRISQFYNSLRAGKFTTTQCKRCSHVAWPPRVICPECYAEDLEWVQLSKRGKVITFSEQVRGVPLGFESPLIHAWIELEPGGAMQKFLSRIINCPAGKLKEGDAVRFVIFEVPAHPIEVKKDTVMAERVFFAFEPVER